MSQFAGGGSRRKIESAGGKGRSHVIDVIFPVAVLFVFAASALIVLMLSSNIYNATATTTDDNYSSRTAFAYVNEKLRQHDTAGQAVSCGSVTDIGGTGFGNGGSDAGPGETAGAANQAAKTANQTAGDGLGEAAGDCLILHGDGVTTYIYTYDGMLKELRLRNGATASAASGRDITAVNDFAVLADGQIVYIDITTEDGTAYSFASSRRSTDK